MNLKGRLKQIILIFYIIQIIAFVAYVFWYWKMNLTFSDSMVARLTLVVTFLSLEGFIVFEWFRRLNEDYARELHDRGIKRNKSEQERDKRRQQLNGYIHEHNRKLIDNVITLWSEDKVESVINEPIATEHLQTGYADLWQFQLEYKNLNDSISSEENAIREYIKNKLNEGLPPNFVQVFSSIDDIGVVHGHFTFDDVVNSIYSTVETFLKWGGVPNNYRLDNNFVGGILVDKKRTDLVEKLETFKIVVKTTIKDQNLYARFEALDKSRKQLYEKNNEFYTGLKQIEHDFNERHIEVKGTCDDCKDWYEELGSL